MTSDLRITCLKCLISISYNGRSTGALSAMHCFPSGSVSNSRPARSSILSMCGSEGSVAKVDVEATAVIALRTGERLRASEKRTPTLFFVKFSLSPRIWNIFYLFAISNDHCQRQGSIFICFLSASCRRQKVPHILSYALEEVSY